ncbi:DNA-directed RNA polymerase specialized sigma24 family protein [Nocardioides nitrophenolicus]|nr:sigma factor [Nocardioides nitrophenolicus]MBM7517589.1 DNA-directed RNA polymerase specialized sigma24 family protein [Nocardioides nitrophenolicus]
MVATDERADFAAFVRSYGNTMKRLGHAVSGDPDIAEDATQSALIKVFKHWHEIEHPRAYARRAVVSECIDRGRRLQREKVTPAGEWGTLPGERGTSPQDQEAWEMREALWQAVRRLPLGSGRCSRCATSNPSQTPRSPTFSPSAPALCGPQPRELSGHCD